MFCTRCSRSYFLPPKRVVASLAILFLAIPGANSTCSLLAEETGAAAAKSPETPQPQPEVTAAKEDGGANDVALPPEQDPILAKLGIRLSVDWKEKSLGDIIAELQAKLKVPILLDQKALDDVGISVDAPVTLKVDEISARSILTLATRPADLTWLIDGEAVLITTPEEAENRRTTRVYDVTDLVITDFCPSGDFDSLMEVITSTLSPCTWDEVGGPGSLAPLSVGPKRLLIVSQTFQGHTEITQLLAMLRGVRELCAKSPGVVLPQPGKQEAAILAALEKPLPVDIHEATLEEVVDTLRRTLGISVAVDRRALDDVCLDGDTPVTIRATGLPAKATLRFVCDQLDLTWKIHDEVLEITTPEEAESRLGARVYDVSDLPSYQTEAGTPVIDTDMLIEMITSTIYPMTWDEVGGPGSICPYESKGLQVLVVAQTDEIHDEIAALLSKIRRLRGPLEESVLNRLPPQPAPISCPCFGSTGAAPAATLPELKQDSQRDAAVECVNRFGFDLYTRLASDYVDNTENLFFSPLGISTAMAMVYGGAKGETADEIGRVFHFPRSDHKAITVLPAPKSTEEVHPGFHSLLKAEDFSTIDAKVCQLEIANRLFVQQGFDLRPEFLRLSRDRYQAEPQLVDFGKPGPTATSINEWVWKQTRSAIPEIVSPESLDPSLRFLLVNAVYFKGHWLSPFSTPVTREEKFFAPQGIIRVRMMCQGGRHRYGKVGDVQVLSKPYDIRTGLADNALSMVILLPPKHPTALRELEKQLSADYLQRIDEQLHTCEVEVFLPKFRTQTSYMLRPVLSAMGMPRVFGSKPNEADLSGISSSSEPLYLDEVVHKAFVEVDEKGTEAAAATAGIFGLGGIAPARKRVPIFRADHPFLFLIRDNRSGVILFLGRVSQPTQA